MQLEGESVLSRLSALYDGQGVDRMLDGTIKILETMRLGMHQNERVNYLPLLTEAHFSNCYNIKTFRGVDDNI